MGWTGEEVISIKEKIHNMAHQVLYRWVPDCFSNSPYIIPTSDIYLLTMVDISVLPAAHLGSLLDVLLHTNSFRCPEHSPGLPGSVCCTPALAPSITTPGTPLLHFAIRASFTLQLSSQGPFHLHLICLILALPNVFSVLS